MFSNILESIFHKEEKALKSKSHVLDIPRSPVITKDNICIQVGGVVVYNVVDYKLYKTGVANPNTALEYLAIVTFRNLVGEYEVNNVMMCLEDINEKAYYAMEEMVSKWGVKIMHVEVNNVVIPENALKK